MTIFAPAAIITDCVTELRHVAITKARLFPSKMIIELFVSAQL